MLPIIFLLLLQAVIIRSDDAPADTGADAGADADNRQIGAQTTCCHRRCPRGQHCESRRPRFCPLGFCPSTQTCVSNCDSDEIWIPCQNCQVDNVCGRPSCVNDGYCICANGRWRNSQGQCVFFCPIIPIIGK